MISSDDDLGPDPEFRRVLVKAAGLYEESKSARVPAIFHAVRAALIRLRETESDDCLRPLEMLLQDLDLLNSGKPARILKPRKGFSAIFPDLADGASIVRQAYALAVQQILSKNYGKRQQGRADKDAAKILSKLGYKTRTGHLMTANNLRQWRPLLGRTEPEYERLQQTYRYLNEQIPIGLSETEARKRATELAKSLTSLSGFDLS